MMVINNYKVLVSYFIIEVKFWYNYVMLLYEFYNSFCLIYIVFKINVFVFKNFLDVY